MSNLGREYTWDYSLIKRQKKPYLEFSEVLANLSAKHRRTAAGLCLHNYNEVPYFGEDKDRQTEKEVSIVCVNCNASYCSTDCFPKKDQADPGGCSHAKSRLLEEKKNELKQTSDERGWDFDYRDWDFDEQQFKVKPTPDPGIFARLAADYPFRAPLVYLDDEDDVDACLVKRREEKGKRIVAPTLELQRPIVVKVTEMQSPSEFYVVPVDNYDSELVRIKATCKLAAKKQNFLENPTVGHDCLAWRQDEDWNFEWFRARVICILPDSVYVRFLDVGEAASILPRDLKLLPEQLCDTPSLAIKIGFVQTRNARIQCNGMQIVAFKRRTSGKCCIFTPHEFDDETQCYFGSLVTDEGSNIYDYSTLFCAPIEGANEKVE